MDRIPIELLNEVLSYLDLPDLKRVRLINPYFNAIATPLYFRTIRFDLRHNLQRIINIASEELARHVRKLVLRMTPLLQEFGGFDTWERSIALPGDPDVDPSEVMDYDGDDSLMSYEEWSGLSDDKKMALYNDYEADRKKEKDLVQSLTSYLCFRKLGCVRGERVHPKRTSMLTADKQLDEASALKQLDEVIKKFSNLTMFEHEPGFLVNYELSSRWRRLRFSLDIIVVETFYKENEDVEAL
ncbi:hypothetical protein K469DRAFT_750754 [Zopfia rhizophila CBS 207.26]|uniref:F-box domain-containing protein n=1 Tax=Zopfia rhizophila CBS 207.26 TaxID=1314779 RepID=A0A6A6DXX4_9PEZI|nr:hypothetical protein K469DRAFT_750754 [Zopfia rhizophila CBS 207.26]